MQRLVLLCLFLALSSLVHAATPAEQELIDLQQRIDGAVAAGDGSFLQGAYADDFRFKHGTGLVDNKESWLKSVEKNRGNFLSRAHSDVEAEIHGDIAIAAGKLKVVRKDNHGYLLDYVRAFVRRDGRWQMIMHRTVVQQNF